MGHKIIGATIRATNRTYGLAPARAWGHEETVAEVVCEYDMTIRTVEGNTYMNGGYTIMRYAEAAGQPIHSEECEMSDPAERMRS